MAAEEKPEKPKIIVDDDWKSQVEREREALRAARTGGQEKSGSDEAEGSPPSGAAKDSAAESAEEPLPPASFELLVSLLVTQALAALGQIPLGEKQEPVVMLDHAKHSIDLLGVLEEKTKGNLTTSESAMLTRVLDELRMVYVAMKNRK